MGESSQLRQTQHAAEVLGKRWLSSATFELVLQKPVDFHYLAGQKIVCGIGLHRREYSLVSSPSENHLALCTRLVDGGLMSGMLAQLEKGDTLLISEAYGFLLYRTGPAVFVATGTGVAPFVSYARAGVCDFILLHGVRQREELYYRSILQGAARKYIPCLSSSTGSSSELAEEYHGRVTDYLLKSLADGKYDFYLCGNGRMIGEAIKIIDIKFPQSRIYSERFF